MLAIARALTTNPELLQMDEPSEGLAPLVIRGLRDTIKQLNSSGLSIFLVEQNFRLALSVADYIYIVSKGQIVFECAPEELVNNEQAKRDYLGVSK